MEQNTKRSAALQADKTTGYTDEAWKKVQQQFEREQLVKTVEKNKDFPWDWYWGF